MYFNPVALPLKYMLMLRSLTEGHVEPLPIFQVRDNLGSKWLGRCSWQTKGGRILSSTTLIQIQKVVLPDPAMLERVIAHEMVHHAEFVLALHTPNPDLVSMRLDGHGAFFRRGAALINAEAGAGYVSEISWYQLSRSSKPFFLMVEPISGSNKFGGTYAYAWGVRLSADQTKHVRFHVAERAARVFRVTDDRWTAGIRLKRFGGLSLPREPERAVQLKRLYLEGHPVVV